MATSSGAASRRQVSPAAGTRRSARASIRAVDDAYAFRYDEIASLRREGRKVVGYVCNYFPVELVHALGAIPIRLAFCSADAMERGKKYVGDSMCPFTRALVGEVTQEGSFTNQHVGFSLRRGDVPAGLQCPARAKLPDEEAAAVPLAAAQSIQ